MVRIDAHHHLWRLSRGDYGWLTPALAAIHRDFTLDDLVPWLRRTGIGATVLVQAAPTVAETEFLLAAAAASDGVVPGVVGWVGHASPGANSPLARLVAAIGPWKAAARCCRTPIRTGSRGRRFGERCRRCRRSACASMRS